MTGGKCSSDSLRRRSVHSIHGRFSWTNGSTFRSGNLRGTTTSTPSTSTRIRACRARSERLRRYETGGIPARLRIAPDLEHVSVYLISGRGAADREMAKPAFPLRRRTDELENPDEIEAEGAGR